MLETRGVVGWSIRNSQKVLITPIAGIGFRYRYDGMGGKKNRYGDYFYDIKSHYLYSPAGMEAIVRLGGGWLLGTSGEYDHFWRGWVHSEFGDLNPDYPAQTNIQKNGWGVRGSVRIIRKLGKRDLVLAPFIRYWNIKESGSFSTAGQEPANNSTEWGRTLGIRF